MYCTDWTDYGAQVLSKFPGEDRCRLLAQAAEEAEIVVLSNGAGIHKDIPRDFYLPPSGVLLVLIVIYSRHKGLRICAPSSLASFQSSFDSAPLSHCQPHPCAFALQCLSGLFPHRKAHFGNIFLFFTRPSPEDKRGACPQLSLYSHPLHGPGPLDGHGEF